MIEEAADLLDQSPAVRTATIRRLRYAGRHPEMLVVVAAQDAAATVQMEAMASLAVVDASWVERLEQAVLTSADTQLMAYGDYLLRELGAWE